MEASFITQLKMDPFHPLYSHSLNSTCSCLIKPGADGCPSPHQNGNATKAELVSLVHLQPPQNKVDAQ